MTEIRWHGRGGLGAFTAARLLGCAVSLYEGKYALAFPSFGPERRGAPVFAFTRIDNKPITDRSEVVECDIAIVLDDTLFGDPVRNGLKPGATVIVNTTRDKAEFAVLRKAKARDAWLWRIFIAKLHSSFFVRFACDGCQCENC